MTHYQSTSDPNAELREEIDAELVILKERIRELHSKRNTISPIYRLPPEILTPIFLYFQDGVIDDSGPYGDEEKYRAWCTILQITQYWREVALGSPEIWADITVTDRRWVEKFIERSGSHPLFVNLEVEKLRGMELLQLVLTEAQRIEHLDLFINQQLWKDAMDLLKFPASQITYLDIGTRKAGRCTLPNDIFSAWFPQLKTLNLAGCKIDFDHPLFKMTNLTWLSITSPADRISISDMLNVLHTLHNLQTALICDALQEKTSPPPSYSPIRHPTLTFLALDHTGLATNIEFLSHINLSKSTEFLLQSTLLQTQPIHSINLAMDAVNQAYQTPHPIYQDICFEVSSTTVTFWLMRNRRFQSGVLAEPVIQMVFKFTSGASKNLKASVDPLLMGLSKSFLEPIRVMNIDTQEVSLDTWRYLEENLAELEHMMVGGRGADSFLRYLVTPPPLPTLDIDAVPGEKAGEDLQQGLIGESEVLEAAHKPRAALHDGLAFPGLRTLTLFYPSFEGLDLDAMYGVLEKRKVEGKELEELMIHEMKDDMQILKDKVGGGAGFERSVKELIWVETK